MTDSSKRRLAVALLFVTPAFWAINYLVARAAAGEIAPHALAFGRWSIALVIMLPLCWRPILAYRQEISTQWPRYLLLGALGMWVCGAFVYIGGRTSPAVNISLIYAVTPVLIAIGSIGWFGERMSRGQIIGAILALMGVLTIVLKGHPEVLRTLRFTQGDFWIATAALAWTLYSLLLRHWRSSLDSFARLTVIAAFGCVLLAPLTLVEAYLSGTTEWSSKNILLVLAAAIFPGIGAYQAYSYVQAQLGAARAGLVLYLGPPYAALSAWLVLGEQLDWYHLVGALLILPGIYFATRKPRSIRANDSDG
jgi:drug/metabolite transporter (DMT)-like permease